jgi:predicted alpha/beta superfamily hydrolase
MGGLMALYGAVAYNHVFQRAACLSPSLWVAPDKMLGIIERAHIRDDTCIYMDYGSKEMANHPGNPDALMRTANLLLHKQVDLTFRIVPGGEHCEASWEKQIPVFLGCLGL